MIDATIKSQLLEDLDRMAISKQKEVLIYAHSLLDSEPVGIPGKDLLVLAGCINEEEGNAMEKAIEEGCEQVNINDW